MSSLRLGESECFSTSSIFLTFSFLPGLSPANYNHELQFPFPPMVSLFVPCALQPLHIIRYLIESFLPHGVRVPTGARTLEWEERRLALFVSHLLCDSFEPFLTISVFHPFHPNPWIPPSFPPVTHYTLVPHCMSPCRQLYTCIPEPPS